MSRFYVCKSHQNPGGKIEICDSKDGIVETLSTKEVIKYTRSGIDIDGVDLDCEMPIIKVSPRAKETFKAYKNKILKEKLAGGWDNYEDISNWYIIGIEVLNSDCDIFYRDTEIESLFFNVKLSFYKDDVVREPDLSIGSCDEETEGNPFPNNEVNLHSSYEFIVSLENLVHLSKDDGANMARKILNCYFHTLGEMFDKVNGSSGCYHISDRLRSLDFYNSEINVFIENEIY